MGWWAQNSTGGIAWGKKEEEGEFLWGDSVADIMDKHMYEALIKTYVECKKVFEEGIGEPMRPAEFLGGIAFCLNRVEGSTELQRIFGRDNRLDGMSLRVELVASENDEESQS